MGLQDTMFFKNKWDKENLVNDTITDAKIK